MSITKSDQITAAMSQKELAIGQSLSLAGNQKTENDQNKEIYSIEQIGNTPFNVITNNETDEKFIAFGNYKMPQKYDTWEYIEKINNRDWSVIMDVIVIFMDIATKKNIIK